MEQQGYYLKEAKTMWCPLTLASEDPVTCKTDKCMAWRWVFFEGSESNSHGYCGMARQIPYTERDAQYESPFG